MKKTSVVMAASAAALILTCASSAYAQYVVQIPVDSILDGRAVTTLTGGAVVTFGNKQDIYSGGQTGYATAAVQMMLAPTSKRVGLPDDGFFSRDGEPATLSAALFERRARHEPSDAPTASLGHGGCAGAARLSHCSLSRLRASHDGRPSLCDDSSHGVGVTPSGRDERLGRRHGRHPRSLGLILRRRRPSAST